MTPSASSSEDPFGMIVDEFTQAVRQGRRPSIEEFAARYPAHADELRELLPALVMMEQAKSSPDATTDGSSTAEVSRVPELRQLGDYRILREVGRGGMGIVYEAEQISLGRRVALKLLPTNMQGKGQQRMRFEREARAAAKLHHTNIVPVFGVGEQDGMCYYVMQFIQGLGLDNVLEELRRLRGNGPISAVRTGAALRVSRKTQAASNAAVSLFTGQFDATRAFSDAPGDSHATLASDTPPSAKPPLPAPISHPTAAQPARAGQINDATEAMPAEARPGSGGSDQGLGRLSDSFSLDDSEASLPTAQKDHRSGHASYWNSVAQIGVQVARALEYAHEQGVLHRDIKPANLLLDTQGTTWVTDFGLAKSMDSQGLTQTGDILGTLRYMPPEAFEGVADRRGDVYSLGLTLYELLALEPAFGESDRTRLIKLVTAGEPRRLDEVNRELPRDLVTIVQKAIDRDVNHRYQTAAELADDLDRFLHDEPIRARRATHAERFVRWSRQNRGLAAALCGVAALLLVSTIVSTIAGVYFYRQQTLQSQLARKNAELLAVTVRKEEDARQAAEKQAELARESLAEKQRALENYRLARRAVDESLSQVAEHPMLSSLGMQGLRSELLRSALGFYEKFLAQQKDDPTLRDDLADALDRVGRITAEIGSPADALAHYQRASELRDQLARENPPDAPRQRLAQLLELEAIGHMHLRMNQFPQANAALQAAEAGWLQQPPDAAQTVQARVRISDGLAEVALLSGDLDVALRLRNQTYSQLSMLEALSAPGPDGLRLRLRKVQAINAIASLNVRMGQFGETHSSLDPYLTPQDLFQRALELLATLEAAASEPQLKIDVVRERASTWEQLADCQQASQNTTQAIDSLQQAWPLREQLVTANPLVNEYHAELAANLQARARMQARQQDWAAAKELLLQAIVQQRVALAASPEAARYIEVLARQLLELATAHEHSQESNLAVVHLGEAAELLDTLQQPTWQQAYAAAVAHARAASLPINAGAGLEPATTRDQHIAAAVGALEKAVAAGLVDLALIESEPALALLKQQPRFLDLSRKLEERVQSWKWHEDINEAAQLAASTNRDLLVYFTGSDWCPWCMTVSQGVFARPEFLSVATQQYVLVKLDFPRFKSPPARLAENSRLAESWGIQGYPTFVFCDAQQRRIAAFGGTGGVEERPQTVEAWLAALADIHARRIRREESIRQADAADPVEGARLLREAFKNYPAEYVADWGEDLLIRFVSARILESPRDVEAYRERAGWYARKGDWAAMAADLTTMVDLDPADTVTPIQAGAAYALARDPEGWRRLAQLVVDRLAATEDPVAAERAAKLLLCTSPTGEVPTQAFALADKSVSIDPNHWVVPWGKVQKCVAEYRAGHDREAIELADQILAVDQQLWYRESQACFVKAMAHQRRDEQDAAFQAFLRGQKLVELRGHATLNELTAEWHDERIGELLRAEAERSLESNHVMRLITEIRNALLLAADWQVLEATEATSMANARLTPQADGSILVSGDTPANDVYTVISPANPAGATALRVEALTDDRLPLRGPGRDRSGQFVLSRVEAQAIGEPAAGALPPIGAVDLTWNDVAADDEFNIFRASFLLNPRKSMGWSVTPGGNHQAVLSLSNVEMAPTARLSVRLVFQAQGSISIGTLGRFRLSLARGKHALIASRALFAFDHSEISSQTAQGVARAIAGDVAAAADGFARGMALATDAAAVSRVIEMASNFLDVATKLTELYPQEPYWPLAIERHYATRNMPELADAARGKAIPLLEDALHATPASAILANLLASELLASIPAAWQVVEPVEISSRGGAKFSVLEDKSVQVSGNNPDYDQYQVKFQSSLARIAGVRLEAIPDSTANGTVGRAENGNFVLTEFGLEAGGPVAFSHALGDQSQAEYPPSAALDNDPLTGWAALPRVSERLEAIFVCRESVELPGQVATAALGFTATNAPQRTLARFRLAVGNQNAVLLEKTRRLLAQGRLTGVAAVGMAFALAGNDDKAVYYLGLAFDAATGDAVDDLLQSCQTFPTVLARLTQQRQADARFLLALARAAAVGGDRAALEFAREKARALIEAQLEDTPGNRETATRFAQSLLDEKSRPWTIFRATEVTSLAGTTLTVQDDGSILASGPNPEADLYMLAGPAGMKEIRAIRLEAIPDPSLPFGASGRASENGNFALTEILATSASPQALQPTEGRFVTARGNHEVAANDHYQQMQMQASNAIDQDDKTYWENFPRGTEPLEAIFVLAEPLADSASDELRIALAFNTLVSHGLGKFRISVSDRADAALDPNLEVMRVAISNGQLAPAVTLAWVYLETGETASAARLLKPYLEHKLDPTGAESCLLALVLQRSGQSANAGQALDQAREWLSRNPMDAASTALFRAALTEVGEVDPSKIAATLSSLAAKAELAQLSATVERDPASIDARNARATWYIQRAEWQPALEDLIAATQLVPQNSMMYLRQGILLSRIGDPQAVAQFADSALARFANTTDPSTAERVVKACLLSATASPPVEKFDHLMGVFASVGTDNQFYDWYQLAKALHDYRSDRYQDTLAACRAGLTREGNAFTQVPLSALAAMASHALGDAFAATESLAAARQGMERLPTWESGTIGGNWADWLVARMLLDEAVARIEEK